MYYVKFCVQNFLLSYLEASGEIPPLKKHCLMKEHQGLLRRHHHPPHHHHHTKQGPQSNHNTHTLKACSRSGTILGLYRHGLISSYNSIIITVTVVEMRKQVK